MPAINRRELETALAYNGGTQDSFLEVIERNFEYAKDALLQDFDSHVITKEILAGSADPIGATNISGTLGGYSNLFAFIGFYKGDDPIGELRGLLENISISSVEMKGTLVMSAKMVLPDNNDILEVTRMPWETGRSWALSIEERISNFSHFMAKQRMRSRSGGGIQVEPEYNQKYRYRPIGYLTPMFRVFQRNLATKTGAYITGTYGQKPSGGLYHAARGTKTGRFTKI